MSHWPEAQPGSAIFRDLIGPTQLPELQGSELLAGRGKLCRGPASRPASKRGHIQDTASSRLQASVAMSVGGLLTWLESGWA